MIQSVRDSRKGRQGRVLPEIPYRIRPVLIFGKQIFPCTVRFDREEKMTARAGTGVNKKRTSSQRLKEEEKREKKEKLNVQKNALASKLAAVDALRSGFEIPVLEGQEVEHVQYGTGTVIRQDDTVVTVRYGDMTRKQKLPFVVAGGLMHLKDAGAEDSLAQIENLDRQGDALRKEMHYIDSLLADLDKPPSK